MGKSGLFPLFAFRSIVNRIDDFVDMREQHAIDVLSYVGEMFVNAARETRTYRDQTGNLRSSIGYVIVNDGTIIKGNIHGKKEGVAYARSTAEELAQEYDKGFVLIGFAGMEYAAAVESRGYDVITGSVPGTAELLDILKRELAVENIL